MAQIAPSSCSRALTFKRSPFPMSARSNTRKRSAIRIRNSNEMSETPKMYIFPKPRARWITRTKTNESRVGSAGRIENRRIKTCSRGKRVNASGTFFVFFTLSFAAASYTRTWNTTAVAPVRYESVARVTTAECYNNEQREEIKNKNKIIRDAVEISTSDWYGESTDRWARPDVRSFNTTCRAQQMPVQKRFTRPRYVENAYGNELYTRRTRVETSCFFFFLENIFNDLSPFRNEGVREEIRVKTARSTEVWKRLEDANTIGTRWEDVTLTVFEGFCIGANFSKC